MIDLRVQEARHADGRRSYLVRDLVDRSIHERADRFLAPFDEGTQRTYAYHLVDHLRWLAGTGLTEDTIQFADLRRYMALRGADHNGPMGVPLHKRPLGKSALAVAAACLKGYYLDLTTRENVNGTLRAQLTEKRLATGRDREHSALGHLMSSVARNPLAGGTPPTRHPRLLPDGARDVDDRRRPHRARSNDRDVAKRLRPADRRALRTLVLRSTPSQRPRLRRAKGASLPHREAAQPESRPCQDTATGGSHRAASSRAEQSDERALRWSMRTTSTSPRNTIGCGLSRRPILCLVHLVGETAGQPLSPHGARQMLDRAGRRAGLGRVRPHAFRHTWATALTEATGGNTKAVADEGGWSNAQIVEDTYAHLGGDPALEVALNKVWGEQP